MADDHYLVLARKWRPQRFEDVVGQEHITRTLQNAIATGRVGHAFLFIGSRGIGKTTTARILAKALNCLAADAPTPHPCCECDNCTSIAEGNNIDVIEIDGASNNSVDDVREIREHIRLVPSRSRRKIYVIDEVHQLSPSAFNALLKTLEEPPVHAVFILATTEAHRIPATIISRCQRYDFRRVGIPQICVLLRGILEKEGRRCSDEALYAIARAAEGGVRDAESILDQLLSYCGEEITFQDVNDVLGLVHSQVLHDLCDAVLTKDVAAQLRIVEDIIAGGKDLSQFIQEILNYFRNLLVCKTADHGGLLAFPEEELAELQKRAARFTLTELIRLVEQVAELSKGFDSQLAQRFALEALLIRISKVGVELSVDTVLEKLLRLGQGGIVPAPQGNAAPSRSQRAGAELMSSSATGRVVVSEDHLGAVWSHLIGGIRKEQLSLGLFLGQGKPARLDGDALVLEFRSQHQQAMEEIETAANRQTIEGLLCSLTENVKTFRSELVQDQPVTDANSGRGDMPIGETVNADEARAALDEPHVAKVVEVFKGRIVDVKLARQHAHEDR